MSLLAAVPSATRAIWRYRMTRADPERVRAVQERRLRRMLRYAVARSAYFRERYRGLDLGRCPLSELPPTNKAELMAAFDDAVTDPRVRRADLERFVDDPANVGRLYLGRYPVCHTSGSSGQSLLVVQEPFTMELLFGFQVTRGNSKFKLGPVEAVKRFINPARLAVISSRNGFFPSAGAWHHFPRGFRPFLSMGFIDAADPRLAERLNDFNPTAITAYPLLLEQLVRQRDRLHLPRLEQVVANSETLTERARERVTAAFGVPVLNNYASGECVFLSNGCPTHAGAHVNADWAILEVVDADNRPVPPGQPGEKVLVTNLTNFVQPFIRYELGDRVTMATRPCACGSRLPRLERVDGRTGDQFWVRAAGGYGRVTIHAFKNALECVREIREWQATQETRDRVRIRLEPLPGSDIDLPRTRHLLDEFIERAAPGAGQFVEVALEVVPPMPADPRTGKFRRMISLVGEPENRAAARDLAAAG
jgi:phenylacetate-CoA ligase